MIDLSAVGVVTTTPRLPAAFSLSEYRAFDEASDLDLLRSYKRLRDEALRIPHFAAKKKREELEKEERDAELRGGVLRLALLVEDVAAGTSTSNRYPY